MKLSTKGRYGLKAMVDLAQSYGNGAVSLVLLAEKQGISEAYLEQLLRLLKRAGLIETTRGVNGGYSLSRTPESISVQQVLEALEGSTAIADCVDGSGGVCENACICSARPLFLTLQAKISAVLSDTSIWDLASGHNEQKRRIENAKSLS